MKSIRVAVAQTAWPGSRVEIIEIYQNLVAEAVDQGADLLCLQEFTLSPYFASVIDAANYAWAEPLHGGPTDTLLGELARTHKLSIVGSLFEKGGGWPLLGHQPRYMAQAAR